MSVIFLIITALILFAVFLKTHSKHKTPAKAAIVNMLLGTATLILISPLADAPVNIYTMFTVLTLGIPGTILIAIGAIVM